MSLLDSAYIFIYTNNFFDPFDLINIHFKFKYFIKKNRYLLAESSSGILNAIITHNSEKPVLIAQALRRGAFHAKQAILTA